MNTALLNRIERRFRLGREDIAALNTICAGRVHRSGAHQDIISSGETSGDPLLFLSGWGACYKSLKDGRRQITSILLPGDFADLTRPGTVMDHSIAALGSVSYAVVPRQLLEEVATSRPRVGEALRWLSLVESATQREWALNIGQRTALERVAHLLCELYLRLSSSGRTFHGSCEFPITQADLGHATGLTSVYVSRTLKRLRDLNIAKVAEGQLEIMNMPLLQKLSMFSTDYMHLNDA